MSSLQAAFLGDTSRFSSTPTLDDDLYVGDITVEFWLIILSGLPSAEAIPLTSVSSHWLYFSRRLFLYCFSFSVYLIKLWLSRSGQPSLSDGFLLSNPFRKDLNYADMESGYFIGSLTIFSTRPNKLFAVKGGEPVASSKRMTPRLHRSAVCV